MQISMGLGRKCLGSYKTLPSAPLPASQPASCGAVGIAVRCISGRPAESRRALGFPIMCKALNNSTGSAPASISAGIPEAMPTALPPRTPLWALAAGAIVLAMCIQAVTASKAHAAAMFPAPASSVLTAGAWAPRSRHKRAHSAVAVVSLHQQKGAALGFELGRLIYVSHYRTLQVLALPTFGKIAALFAVGIPLVVGGAALHRWASGAPWPESLVKTYYVLNSVPGVDISAERTKKAMVVLNIVHVLSLFTFATLVGVLTTEVARGIEAVRSGNYPVPETRHTVIVGWDSQRTPMLLQQLMQARDERGALASVRPPFVLLIDPSQISKQQVDLILEEELGQKLGRDVVTRVGSPLQPEDLQRVSAGHAATIILTASPQTAGRSSVVGQRVDGTSSLVATLASLHSISAPGTRQSVVVESGTAVSDWITSPAGSSVQRMLAERGRHVVSVANLNEIADILAQSSFQPGLTSFFDQICVQGLGAEFYILKQHGFAGRTFREARLSFPNAALCGMAHKGTSKTRFNPPDTQEILPSDALIFLSNDAHAVSAKVEPEAVSTDGLVFDPSAAAQARRPHAVVVLMPTVTDKKGAAQVLKAMGQITHGNAHITLVGKAPEDQDTRDCIENAVTLVRKSGHSFTWVKEDATSQQALINAGAASAQAVVIPPPGDDWGAEDVDAQVLAIELQLVDLLHHHRDVPRTRPLRLVASVMKEGTEEVLHSVAQSSALLAEEGGATVAKMLRGDHPVTHNHRIKPEVFLKDKLMTGLLGQVAAEPLIQGAFNELFSQDGAEVYTRNLNYFQLPAGTPLLWKQIQEYVRTRSELAIGIVNSDGVVLALPANTSITLTPEDRLVVLADN